jgi:hypothetical protein
MSDVSHEGSLQSFLAANQHRDKFLTMMKHPVSKYLKQKRK